MNLLEATYLAKEMCARLRADCERGPEIAGSIRRQRPECHDIDLVLVPRLETAHDLFGAETTTTHQLLDARLGTLGEVKKHGPREKQILLPQGIHLELWCVLPPAQWGAVMTIRTGPGDFSHWLVTSKRQGGAMPAHLKQADGALWNSATLIETPTEESYFAALGLEWIEPEERRGMWVRTRAGV